MCCRHAARDPFLQQQLGSLHGRVAVKPILHGIAVNQIVERYQTHTLMMGHVRAHQGAALALLDSLRRVVQCLVKTIA